MGAVNITEPYIDASTGEMCYSISKLLSDGSTIVGLDFNLSGIQQYIEEMNSNSSGTSFIVDAGGMIVGHSQPEYVGRDYRELDFYNELVNKVYMLYGNSFDFKSDGVKYNVFSYKTNYDWYLVVCVKSGEANALPSSDTLHIAVVMMIVAAAVVLLFIQTCREKMKAEKALADNEAHLKNMSLELKRPLSRIMNRADILGSYGENGSDTGDDISDSAKELDRMLELSGKAGNYAVIEEKNGELLDLYRKVEELGKEYLGDSIEPKEEAAEDVQLEEIAVEKAKEQLLAVMEACLAYDSDEAERLCGELTGRSVNGQPLKPVLDEIMAAANDFEYEAAAEKAEKFAKKL